MAFRKVPFVGGPLDGKTHDVPLDGRRHLPHEVVYEHHEPYIISSNNPNEMLHPLLPERYCYFVKPIARNSGFREEEFPVYLYGSPLEDGSLELDKLFFLAKKCWNEGIFP